MGEFARIAASRIVLRAGPQSIHETILRQFSSLWTPRLTRRILCSMTLSARNRLEGEVVEIQFGGVMAHISSALRFVTTLSIRFFPARMTIKSTEVMLEKN